MPLCHLHDETLPSDKERLLNRIQLCVAPMGQDTGVDAKFFWYQPGREGPCGAIPSRIKDAVARGHW